ncbi:MAG: TRAP transporter small permease [Alphaproteobacteria bacterium]
MTFGQMVYRITDWLLDQVGSLVGIAYGAVAVLMTLDIAIRGLNLGALPWLIELTEYILYGGTFLAAPWALRLGAHVRVDLLLSSVRKSTALTLERIVDCIGLLVSAVFLYFGSVAVIDAWRENLTQFKTWSTPEWILLLPIPFAALLMVIEFILRIGRVPGTISTDYDPTKKASI